MMQIEINPLTGTALSAKPEDESTLGFGKIYADHMMSAQWTPDTDWTNANVRGFEPLVMSPAALVLHYGQTIFEGLKAYRTADGTINLFRPDMNWKRFNNSAQRLDLPQISEDLFMAGINELIKLDHAWVPHSDGASLYIRPTMIAMEPYIGLKSAADVLFFIITGPVGAYYANGFSPVRIRVSEQFTRAAPGGLGAAKTAANYAASLLAARLAAKDGYDQVLWLDACDHRYVEEVGSMNIFFKIDGKVLTPSLDSGTTLPGVTRDSVLQLLKHWNIDVEETRIDINDVIAAQKSGALEEIFGSGTAAVISPVSELEHQGQTYRVQDGSIGALSQRVFDELTGIQYGRKEDTFGWIRKVAI